MSQIRVVPQQLQSFAEKLGAHATHVSTVRNRLTAGLKDLHGTWRDERYRQFNDELTGTMAELERFVRTARRYSEYLEDKARKAKKFLNRSR